VDNDSIKLLVGSSILRVVPAVHYRLPFARAMNAICADPTTRPEAIAVELGPEAAACVADWIRELGADKGKLPAMLGLSMKNNAIRVQGHHFLRP
jgi:hypothetical protein